MINLGALKKTLCALVAGLIAGLAGLLFGYQQKSKRLARENRRLKKAHDVQSDMNEATIDSEIRAEKERAQALDDAHNGQRDHFE